MFAEWIAVGMIEEIIEQNLHGMECHIYDLEKK